jgi:hypothetical protein
LGTVSLIRFTEGAVDKVVVVIVFEDGPGADIEEEDDATFVRLGDGRDSIEGAGEVLPGV